VQVADPIDPAAVSPSKRVAESARPDSPSPAEVESALARALAESDAPDVACAYLLGSVAEQRSHRESDVDVGVLLAWTSFATKRDRFDAAIRLGARL
jgi:predicted nucleotidyltransferase